MNEQVQTRDLILKAAVDRILHYGYSKTTMAEIARDCDMSAGNIYRFFNSKLDIAEAMARQKSAMIFQVFAEISRRSHEGALFRLSEFFTKRLQRTFEVLEKNDKILEIAEVLGKERPEYVNEQLAQERVYIARILEQGVDSGEIRPLEDPAFTAEMLQTALMKFEYPQLWSNLTLAKLEQEFEGVMDLLRLALENPNTKR
ncbi:MAG: TetR family transcriptional regulator [Ponticaulis sp.]|nr:TetR family transcriptional regulator [Ponticaulis sp.]|tara:strand:+ start:12441 stop:13043 length:603 start_codon:yes stop_codon:yes gene_type:complete